MCFNIVFATCFVRSAEKYHSLSATLKSFQEPNKYAVATDWIIWYCAVSYILGLKNNSESGILYLLHTRF